MTQARSFDAFAAVYADHRRAVWAYLVRLGASATAAEDLTQETFVRWLNHGREPDQPGSIRAFLFTTATRLLTDLWRRERRLVQWDDQAPEAAADPASNGLLLSSAWTGLSRREQQLLWLAYAEEFSHAEIAGVTGLAPDSIKVLLSRARNRLKAKLQTKGDDRA